MINQKNYTLTDFNNSLAQRVKQTDCFGDGVWLNSKDVALTHKYIQFNDLFIKFMVFDLDRENSAMDWELVGLPSPNIVVQNKLNGRCHYIYALEAPICNTVNARRKPIVYFERIQQAYVEKLGQDRHYVNVFTKNPNCDFWRTFVFNVPAYSLDYLADFVDLSNTKIRYQYRDEFVEGRNCDLFNQIKRIGYREVLKFKKSGKDLSEFNHYLLSYLEQLNQHQQPPLAYRELKGIAKSSARWIWERFTEKRFQEIQSNRAKKRWTEQQIIKSQLIEMFGNVKPDMSLKQIAKTFGVSLSTINRWAEEFGWATSKKDLSAQYQQLSILRNQGLKWREIAEQLGISESSAKMCFKRYKQS